MGVISKALSVAMRDTGREVRLTLTYLRRNGLASDFERFSVLSHCETVSALKTRKLGLGRGQFSSNNGVGKGASLMAAVAKRLIGGLPAAAETDGGTPRESEGLALRIDDLEIAFDTKRAVVIHGDPGCGQFFLLGRSIHHTALLASQWKGRLDRLPENCHGL